MKIAKYIFLLLLLISITISVFVATKDGNYTVTKSKQIDVSKEIVFNYVSDSKNWETINPWNAENTKVKWVQKIDGETILQNIIINEVPAELKLTFKDTLSKKTIVTWTTHGKLSFKDKFLSIINRGKHNDFAEKFENGLNTLNTILTTEINSFSVKLDGFVNRDTVFYIQQVVSCKVEDLPAKIKNVLPKLNELLKITNTSKNGAPFIVYHSIDSLANKITVSVAIPTKNKVFTSTESDIYTGQTNPFQAVKATLTGNYNHKKEALAQLYEFMDKNKLERSDRNKVFEIIPVNSLTEKSAAKWVTEIYIPVRPKKITVRVQPVKNDTINTMIESNVKGTSNP
ncbi:MAG: GyrI-like domain-containing protein [Flavobacterium sp.]|uniref:GyrI-like domain-containing protein n=1 Tax=Flavobacterium sp. TaxID=239 RepID=UPI00326362EC